MTIPEEINKILKTRPENPAHAVDCPICGGRPFFFHPEHLNGEMVVLGCNLHEYEVSFGNSNNALNFEEMTINYNKTVEEYLDNLLYP